MSVRQVTGFGISPSLKPLGRSSPPTSLELGCVAPLGRAGRLDSSSIMFLPRLRIGFNGISGAQAGGGLVFIKIEKVATFDLSVEDLVVFAY